jgi:hypothetical protein
MQITDFLTEVTSTNTVSHLQSMDHRRSGHIKPIPKKIFTQPTDMTMGKTEHTGLVENVMHNEHVGQK